jgi:Holliday junction resolvasome RuvABC ATP-dependent DNA helicase subunit
LLGPASTGKTTLAKMFADLLQLPFVEISPRSIETLGDIATKIASVCENTKLNPWEDGIVDSLELQEIEKGHFFLPPMVIFIDEVHALRKNIEQGLLQATERKDCTLVTENGWTIDTSNVTWIIATTDRGSLFDAFDTRFMKIHLRLYSLDEIAQIIHVNNREWDMDICRLAAKYGGRVPREALAFVEEVRMEHGMGSNDWEQAVKTVASDLGIDEFGMTLQRVNILTALGQGAIARGRLGDVAQCKEEELMKFIMPPLLAKTPDQEPLVSITSRGFCITEAGIAELDRRGIKHIGFQNMAANRNARNRITSHLLN